MQRRGGHNLDPLAYALGSTAEPEGSLALAFGDRYRRQRLEKVRDRTRASLEALDLEALAQVRLRIIQPVLPERDVAEHQQRHGHRLHVLAAAREIQARLKMAGGAGHVLCEECDQS